MRMAKGKQSAADALSAIERLLDAPCWVIDVLPSQVPADSGGQFFAAEHLLTKGAPRKFARVLVKLGCYCEFVVARGEGHKPVRNPSPKKLRKWVAGDAYGLSVWLPGEDALMVVPTQSTCMALHGPSARLLELVRAIAASEGLFVWQSPDESQAPANK